jgi:predicted amidophosphoribosyltransferase
MNCPSCQAALPEDAAFCGHCGGALRSERTCARCGRSNSPEMRFCLGCGAALARAGNLVPPGLSDIDALHQPGRLSWLGAAENGCPCSG